MKENKNMKATILHNDRGEILAISRIADLSTSGSKFKSAGMMAAPGQRIIEVELPAEDGRRGLSELHKHYRVDVSKRELVRQ
jgi:hypothetical protein